MGICCVNIFGSLDYNKAAGGIWGGVFIIVAGTLSIVSGLKPRQRLLNILNLSFHSWALCICFAGIVLFARNIE